MAILVDELREYPDVPLPFTTWCHMATDGPFEELHAFAERLGLRRAWFQRDHYDLPPHGRAAAVRLGAIEVGTGELLLRMTGPRGDRARRRALAPAGVTWLRDAHGPAVLRYPPGALLVIGGPPGAGKSTLAARAVDRGRVLLLDPDEPRAADGRDRDADLAAWRVRLGEALAMRSGAVAVTNALHHGHRVAAVEAAAAAGVPAHLLLLDAGDTACRADRAAEGPARTGDGRFEQLLREWAAYRKTLEGAGDPAPFESVTVVSAAAVDRLRRIVV